MMWPVFRECLNIDLSMGPTYATAMSLPSFTIGTLEINPGLVLAPMSGVTDTAFRRIVLRCSGDAVGLVMSEFISIEGLTRQHMQGKIRLAFHPSERPVALQIFGANPHKMADAARIIEDAGADLVDINCGCPAPKVVKRGGGAGLLRDLPLLARVLEAAVQAVSIPVTLKIRNGWSEDTINALETLKVAEDHGAQAISVHGRTRSQLYRGKADWDIILAMKQRARIPVLGSGDISSAQDALSRLQHTRCDGVMVGRAAITNPWIFREIADVANGLPIRVPTWRERLQAVEDYRALLEEIYPQKAVPGRLKQMLSRLLKGLPSGNQIRVKCLRSDTPEAMMTLLWNHFSTHGLLDKEESEGTFKPVARQGWEDRCLPVRERAASPPAKKPKRCPSHDTPVSVGNTPQISPP
jgi:tRNA-dihydrouridine synthase B